MLRILSIYSEELTTARFFYICQTRATIYTVPRSTSSHFHEVDLQTVPLRTTKSAVGLAKAAGRAELAAVRKRASDAWAKKMEQRAEKQRKMDNTPGKNGVGGSPEDSPASQNAPSAGRTTRKLKAAVPRSTYTLSAHLAAICGRFLRCAKTDFFIPNPFYLILHFLLLHGSFSHSKGYISLFHTDTTSVPS